MTLNAYLKGLDLWNVQTMRSWNVWDTSTASFPVFVALTKQHGICSGKYLLKTPGNAISETSNFQLSLDASALKNLCLWCKFQSCLLLKNFLDIPELYKHTEETKVQKSLFFVLFVCLFFAQYSTVVFVEMSAKMRSLDREVRGLRMEKEDIERVSVDFICFVLFFPLSK